MSAITDTHGSTSVLAGLECIADKPEILSVEDVPVSLWLRSEPDESANGEDRDTVVRICTQGQDKNDTASLRERVSASHPIHFELCVSGDEPPSLDLSVFGTPAEVSDEDIIQGWNAENFAYTKVDKVTEFGRFEQQLPRSTVKPSKRVCHVYLYVEVSRLSVELYAIFAHDGRAVKPLEKTPSDRALQNGKLTTKWKKYQGVGLGIVQLKQVARPDLCPRTCENPQHREAKNLKPIAHEDPRHREASNPKVPTREIPPHREASKQRPQTATSCNQNPAQCNWMRFMSVEGVERRRHRSPSNRTKRRTISSLAATKRKRTSSGSGPHTRGIEDGETESEMEM